MPAAPSDLTAFSREVRRLAGAGEPPLYPAFSALIRAAYPPQQRYNVDSLRRTAGAGFPDLTVSDGPRKVMWIEIKHPSVNVRTLPALDLARFDRYRVALPHIVLTNGWDWVLYVNGAVADDVTVPQSWLTHSTALSAGDEAALTSFLSRVAARLPAKATNQDDAIRLLATAARIVCDAVEAAASSAAPPGPLLEAHASFTELLRTNPADPSTVPVGVFADAFAQTTVFGFLLSRMEAGSDIEIPGAHGFLDTLEHPFLKATLHAIVAPDPAMEAALEGPLKVACDFVNAAAPQLVSAGGGGWKSVVYVYEPFFAAYRPADVKKYGVFYTPEEITAYQVNEIQATLRNEFGAGGLLDQNVRFLDPACGTGSYLLALAEAAEAEAIASGAPVGAALHELFTSRVFAFEVSPGPAVVAQVRLSAWLRARNASLGKRVPIYVVNTLSPPATGGALTGSLWAHNVSAEQRAGDQIKQAEPILVVLGNPPWGDRPKSTFDIGGPGNNLVEPWAAGATGAVIHLYDLYVAFWRFAASLLVERPGVQPRRGIASFITNRSWLHGRSTTGMRDWFRAHGAVAHVTDLGGDSRAGSTSGDQNVFAIQAGTAIATVSFNGTATTDEYRRVSGNRASKLDMLNPTTPTALPPFVAHPASGGEPFIPGVWGALADANSIRDFFAADYPGVKTHRDPLVVDVDQAALAARLQVWSTLVGPASAVGFHATTDRPVPAAHTVQPGHITPFRYRPLDDRYLYNAREFIDRPGKISRFFAGTATIECLVSMDSRTSDGPVVIATDKLPGYNSFRGSYETHVYPLAPAAAPGALPNIVTAGVLSPAAVAWTQRIGLTTRQAGCYLLALGNAPSYHASFREALASETARFPATDDRTLAHDAATLGESLLDAWCLRIPPAARWVSSPPAGAPLGSADHDGTTCVTFAGGATLTGVSLSVWKFKVSGFRVLPEYLAAREHTPLTTALGDAIRRVIAAINTIVSAQSASDALLSRALGCTYSTL